MRYSQSQTDFISIYNADLGVQAILPTSISHGIRNSWIRKYYKVSCKVKVSYFSSAYFPKQAN